VIIRGQAEIAGRGLVEVEFEIPDDSPEAQALRADVLRDFSVVEPEQCVNLYCQRDMPHELTPECPWSAPDRPGSRPSFDSSGSRWHAPLATKDGDKPWKSGGGAGQWNG